MWLGFGADYRDEAGIEASTPLEQAYPLVFLCSDAASGVTGITMITDAGYFAAGVSGSFPAGEGAIGFLRSDLSSRDVRAAPPAHAGQRAGSGRRAPTAACASRAATTAARSCTRRCRSARRAAAGRGAGRRCRAGRTVVGFTVNHHQWLPGFEPPYVDRQRRARRGPDACA